MRIDDTDIIYIPESENNKNLDTYLEKGDVVLSKTAYPAASIVQLDRCNVSQDTVAIKLKKSENIDGASLVVFLNTKYGLEQMRRWFTGNIQMHLNLTDCKGIFIPDLGDCLRKSVSLVFWNSLSMLDEAKEIYNSAESLLLSEIELEGFVPRVDNLNTKAYSESFLLSGRLDSEYYLPKYDDYSRLVSSYKGGVQPLSEACNLKDKNYSPEDNQEYQYIELSNIGNSGEITGCTLSHGKDLPSRARRIVRANDVVVSSIEGSLESCAIVPKAYDGALCSTGFYVVSSKGINSETLLILFKSKPIQAILKQNCSGTILTAINKTDFLNIPIPLIDENVQKEIQAKLKESIVQREKSESLLKIAKRAVEIAIEQDEIIAERYIQDECQKIGVVLNERKS